MVDIVIGTHRVLSKDVAFKDLGLLIIDEEQRFGVTHKEKDQKNERKCGRTDADGDTNSEDTAHESDRDSRYECFRGTANGQNADTDLCYGV